jgi:YgiT-type zinc finger domain-containing protein
VSIRCLEEGEGTKCRVCGGRQEERVTDLPFKVSDTSIVIVKALPLFQCRQCGDIELEDAIMTRVDQVLSGIDTSAELEVVRFGELA